MTTVTPTHINTPSLCPFTFWKVNGCLISFTYLFFFRYTKLLGDENPFLNDEGFGHLNHWAAENDTHSGMEEYPMFRSIFPTVAKILMFLLGNYSYILFIIYSTFNIFFANAVQLCG